MKVLVTGASGYIGRALIARLKPSIDIVALGGVNKPLSQLGVEAHMIDLAAGDDGAEHMCGVHTVVHLAGSAHRRRTGAQAANAFMEINCAATRRLALAAADAGVKRFVFVSSIGVNGEEASEQLTEASPPAPASPYAVSKWEAEKALTEIGRTRGLEIVCIRPPLVIGPGAPGSLSALLYLVGKQYPLPLGSVRARRNYVALDNLLAFIELCIRHPAAGNETFLLADEPAMTTPELIQQLAAGQGLRAKLLPFPVFALRMAAVMLGKTSFKGLWTPLLISSAKARALLGWQAPVPMGAAIAETARAYSQAPDTAITRDSGG